MNKITPEHRQQHLAGAAELAKAGKDQPDDLLYSAVRIETEANLAMPDVADRHADPQFAAARLGAGGVEHAGPQYAELKLADAAFHAEQQPIVRPAGIVDPIEVNHPSVDQPAQF